MLPGKAIRLPSPSRLRIREEAKDNLAFSKVPDYLIENNTFKLSGDPITPDEYMEDYYKRMSEEQAASEDAKEE